MIQIRSNAPPPVGTPSTSPVVLKVMVGLLLMSALGFGFVLRANPVFWPAVRYLLGFNRCGYGSERNASTSLKTLTSAEADFRANDRDWNHVNDFWRGDVAGLYTLKSAADPTGPAIKLIELSVASADDRPVSDLSPYAIKSAKAGYWYRAILHEDEGTPAPDRFAFCAFPDSPSAGKWTFIVDEQNIIYRRELKDQRGVERYPLDPIKAGWQRLD